ncbi:hypothetical protein F4703DRAFT_1928722 [Phycomyces blakesleeanus]
MTASELSSEILSQIAEYLSTKDRLSGSITCKTWRYPFQDSLWRDIQVDTRHPLKDINDRIKPYNNAYTPYGFMVHNLRFETYYEMIMVQQDDFISYLPELKHLDCKTCDGYYMKQFKTKSKKIWMSLESLKTDYHGPEMWSIIEPDIGVLIMCPMLQKLEFYKELYCSPKTFSLPDFDSIHQTLKQLSHFNASFRPDPDDSYTDDEIIDTPPAITMATLDIMIYKFSPRWLYYVSYKYPNLRSLKLDISNSFHGWTDHTLMERIAYTYPCHAKGLQHLETLELTTPSISDWVPLVFWEFIDPLRSPLKNIKFKAAYPQDDSLFFAQLYATYIKRSLKSFSETLETLSIEGTAFFDIKYGPPLELSSYAPFLKDLYIKSCGISINLENVLDKCPALKRLRYFGGQLLINSITINQDEKDQRHHGLEILELRRVVTSAEVFSRLSFRCRRLQYMNLSSLLVSGSISKKTGCLLLDMPYTFFKVVRLAHIKYRSPYKRIYGDTIISLTLVSQLNDHLSLPSLALPSSRTATNIDLKEVNPESLAVVTHRNIAWFHTFLDVVFETDTRIGIRQLSEQEASTAVGFYQSFQSNRDNQPRKVDMPLDGNNLKEDWKDKLCRGYGELRCGQVEKYILPSDSKYDKYFWKYSYIRSVIVNPKNTSRSCGRFVHGLRIGDCCTILNRRQDEFFKSMPNLKHLNLGCMTYQEMNKNMTRSNAAWMSLESLRIEINYNQRIRLTPDFVEFLKTISKLQRLEIFTRNQLCLVIFGQNDFDDLHKNLQRLSSIKAYISLDFSATLKDSTVPDIIPALALTALDLRLGEWSPLCMYYFCYKYPNLLTLKLDVSNSYTTVHYNQIRGTGPPFYISPDALRHLDTFEYITKEEAQNTRTLERILIAGGTDGDRSTSSLELSSYCPLLVDITIKDCNVSIDLDNLLDNCVALKQLRLFGCRRLEYMSLVSTYAKGPISEKTGCLLLDMSYTFFKILLFGNVTYCSSDEYGNEKSVISVSLLSQLNKPIQSNDKKEEGKGDSVSNVTNHRNLHHIAWFYNCRYNTYSWDRTKGIVQLSEETVDTFVEYFQNFQSNKISEDLGLGGLGGNPIMNESWKLDLYKGYGEFRCGNIDKYIVYGVTDDNEVDWDKLYDNLS